MLLAAILKEMMTMTTKSRYKNVKLSVVTAATVTLGSRPFHKMQFPCLRQQVTNFEHDSLAIKLKPLVNS